PVDTEEDLKTSTVSRPNWLKLVIGRIDEQFVVVLIDDISESVRFSQMRDDFVTNVSEMIIRPSEDLQRLADVLEHGGMSPEQVAQAA
ncbi:histidine kinase, partial [Salmonella enterica subsp. enterica serovar Istanbul]|nr:histidine kinase [Salmonella enterica subsp. enterica serovar Istanbul]